MSLHLLISYAFGGGMRRFVYQNPGMDVTVMGYWMKGQLSTMGNSVMYKNKFRMGYMTLIRFS